MIEIKQTPLDGLVVITPRIIEDPRGYFFQTYHEKEYHELGITDNFIQDNEALSHKGVLRGLHYQVGKDAQSKLVRVVRGAVFDVAVDLRPSSRTYGQWYGLVLDAREKLQLYVPAGFAHGYLVLEDDTIFSYKCGAFYAPEAEGGIRYDDPELKVEWPKLDGDPIVSGKDLALPKLGAHRPILVP